MSYRDKLIAFVRKAAQPPEKFGHMPRLDRLAREIGTGIPHDADVVFAAVWLHDLGVFTGHRPEDPVQLSKWDHTTYAMEKTPGILTDLGFPADKIPAVVETIRTHLPGRTPTTVEGTIVRDADILEQLGAITVLRTAVKVGRDTRYHTLADVVMSLEKQLATLPALLQLDAAKRLAGPKVDALRRFLDAVRTEAGQDL
jgi:uncharacterized protein